MNQTISCCYLSQCPLPEAPRSEWVFLSFEAERIWRLSHITQQLAKDRSMQYADSELQLSHRALENLFPSLSEKWRKEEPGETGGALLGVGGATGLPLQGAPPSGLGPARLRACPVRSPPVRTVLDGAAAPGFAGDQAGSGRGSRREPPGLQADRNSPASTLLLLSAARRWKGLRVALGQMALRTSDAQVGPEAPAIPPSFCSCIRFIE